MFYHRAVNDSKNACKLLTVITDGMQFFSLGNFHCLLNKGQCVLYIRQTNFRTLNTILQKSIIEKVVHSVDTKLQGYIPENPVFNTCIQ